MNLAESRTALEQAIETKKTAKRQSFLMTLILGLVEEKTTNIVMFSQTLFEFDRPLSTLSRKRLSAFGFEIINNTKAKSEMTLTEGFTEIRKMVSKRFLDSEVTNIVIDDEFGCVTATIDGVTNVGCGYLEDYG
jgi:hypothetical protein